MWLAYLLAAGAETGNGYFKTIYLILHAWYLRCRLGAVASGYRAAQPARIVLLSEPRCKHGAPQPHAREAHHHGATCRHRNLEPNVGGAFTYT